MHFMLLKEKGRFNSLGIHEQVNVVSKVLCMYAAFNPLLILFYTKVTPCEKTRNWR